MDINDILISDEVIDAIEHGKWVASKGSLCLKVRGLSSNAVHEHRHRLLGSKKHTEGELEQLSRRVLVDCVLLGWRGLKNDGEPVRYNKKLAERWVMSDEGTALVNLITDAALQVDALQVDRSHKLT